MCEDVVDTRVSLKLSEFGGRPVGKGMLVKVNVCFIIALHDTVFFINHLKR